MYLQKAKNRSIMILTHFDTFIIIQILAFEKGIFEKISRNFQICFDNCRKKRQYRKEGGIS